MIRPQPRASSHLLAGPIFLGQKENRSVGCFGFTLIEVLVAISITAIIGVGAALTLQSGVKTKEAVEARSAELASLQKFQRIVATDLSQIVSRTARNEWGDQLYACTNLNALTLLEFSRVGWRDPKALLALINPELELKPRSHLQRVVYELEEDALYRYYWRVMDRSQDSEPVRQRVLEKVISLELRFLDENNEWSEQWPPANLLNNDAIDPLPVVPKAIEMTVEHEVFGEFSRLHLVAGWNAHSINAASTKGQQSPLNGSQSGSSQQGETGLNNGGNEASGRENDDLADKDEGG